MIVSLLGGIGLFLLGMSLMTDGLKALAGGALRQVLTRMVRGPLSGLFWGTTVTAMVQSSTATTMTTIGFVSAGLLSFPQAVGVIFGANLGTTSTGWLVSLLGFKLSVGAAALPLIFAGAMMKLLGRERLAAAGLALAGFGMLFLGIDMLQLGMAGLADRIQPADLPGTGWGGRLLLVGIGIVMTVVMQSSSAAVATTLVALNAGTITLDQAAAMVIGQNVGTAVTSAIAAIGASVPAKRTALAHILFNVLTGVVAFSVLPIFTRIVDVAADWMTGEPGATELAAFHTAFNIVGVVLLLPFVRPFSRMVARMVPDRGPLLTRNLDWTVGHMGPVAVEAARRTVVDVAAVVVEAARSLTLGEGPRHRALEPLAAAEEAIKETRRFVGRLGAAQQSEDERRRHVSTMHAIDHVSQLLDTCQEAEPPETIKHEPLLREIAASTAAVLATAERWLKTEARGRETPGSAPVDALRAASVAIAAKRKAERAKTLDRTGAGELDPDRALAQIDTLRWLDRIGYHVWRSAHHLQEPPPRDPAPGVETFSDAPVASSGR